MSHDDCSAPQGRYQALTHPCTQATQTGGPRARLRTGRKQSSTGSGRSHGICHHTSKRHEIACRGTRGRTSGDRRLWASGSRRPHKSHLRSSRIADSHTLSCLTRAHHNTRKAFDLPKQSAQSERETEPQAVHGYTAGWASGAQQNRARERGAGVGGRARALRALMLGSATANRARLAHLSASRS